MLCCGLNAQLASMPCIETSIATSLFERDWPCCNLTSNYWKSVFSRTSSLSLMCDVRRQVQKKCGSNIDPISSRLHLEAKRTRYITLFVQRKEKGRHVSIRQPHLRVLLSILQSRKRLILRRQIPPRTQNIALLRNPPLIKRNLIQVL
jgi:hypothetical protein